MIAVVLGIVDQAASGNINKYNFSCFPSVVQLAFIIELAGLMTKCAADDSYQVAVEREGRPTRFAEHWKGEIIKGRHRLTATNIRVVYTEWAFVFRYIGHGKCAASRRTAGVPSGQVLVLDHELVPDLRRDEERLVHQRAGSSA